MKRKINSITILVLCLIVGLATTMLTDNSKRYDGIGLVSINEIKSYEDQLQKLRADKKIALQELSDYENGIEKFEKEKTSEDAYLKLEMENIEKYKMSAGFVEVKGTGVIITIEDPDIIEGYLLEDESVIIENYDLLISLVNKLKRAGGEAVSINGQRIIATTEFNYVGDAIYINMVPTAPPYIIKAIGEPNTMESQLEIQYGIIDTMRNLYGLHVNIEKKKELQIPRYYGDLKFKYAKPL